ncbi:MAG: 4-(cytidine 5'-diphospho)-2-C-methyl-D-erythritol kinase [Candidatus Omnitrophica bacterium]|nr:4-(cytidine 5'-diphospho)-2-C-methyl-D-erythritol kinase [Candidatus Omnitrophota bacterium]
MLEIKAPAKVNLFLEVGEKDNSLHKIFSLIDLITLYDYIYIKPSNKTEIRFISEWEIPEDNTITKLILLLKEKFKFEVEITIKKNIPPASGLGGGSSNCASVLIFLNKIFGFNLKTEEMIEIAKKVGSDVPLFLFGKRCIIRNYGEVIEVCDDFKLFYLLLVPNLPVSTKQVYDRLDKISEYGSLTDCYEKVRILIEKIKCGDIEGAKKIMFNRLEKPCFDLNKTIKEVRDEVEKITGEKFFLSGSGGTLFAVFKEKEKVSKVNSKIFLENWRKFEVESLNFGL